MSEKLTPLITAEAIDARVGELARRISEDYAGRELLAVGILKGAWLFMADLVRRLTIPVLVDFMGISSYGGGTLSSGVVRISCDLSVSIRDRHVLVVEDIIDTGLTTRYLLDNLESRQPASIGICALLDKAGRRKAAVPLDYVGFAIPDRFVVGYGLDYDQRYRQLPYVAELSFD
jgi:hypoxanthine phosphoribosyltransferase